MTRNIISVLALVVVMIASVFYMFTIGFSVTKNRNTNTVSMELPRTNGLLVGSRVLYRGVEVGYVTDVAATVDKVAVRWNFKRDYDIPVDSVFRVDNLSALGETYLGVFPVRDSGPWLTDGAVLAADRITVPTTVDQLSERFSRLMNQVDVPGVQTIVKETNAGLTQDQTTIDSLARGSKLLQKTFLSTRPEFATLLDRMQQLFRNGTEVSDDLVAAGPSIRLFGKNFGAVLDKLGGAVIAVNLPAGLDGAVVMVPAEASAAVVEECIEAGIPRVWLHQGAGPSSATPEAVALCREHGIEVVDGACPMMFFADATWFHRVHRWGREKRGGLTP